MNSYQKFIVNGLAIMFFWNSSVWAGSISVNESDNMKKNTGRYYKPITLNLDEDLNQYKAPPSASGAQASENATGDKETDQNTEQMSQLLALLEKQDPQAAKALATQQKKSTTETAANQALMAAVLEKLKSASQVQEQAEQKRRETESRVEAFERGY